MRDYACFLPRFWITGPGKKFRGSPDVQLVAAYLFTSPSANMIGIYYLPIEMISHDTGVDFEQCRGALKRLVSQGFCEYDNDTEIVWVKEMAQVQILRKSEALSPTDKQVKGVANTLAEYRKHRFYGPFLERYRVALCLDALPSPSEAPSKPLPDPKKPLRSQDQDQDQDQDQLTTNLSSDEPDDLSLPGVEKGPRVVNGVRLAANVKRKPKKAEVELWEFWKLVMRKSKAHVLDNKRLDAMRRALSNHTLIEMKKAVLGCRHSEFHQGKNDRDTKFNDIELICRDEKHFSEFIRLYQPGDEREYGEDFTTIDA